MLTSSLILAVDQGILFALAAVMVRTQLTLTTGFDFSVAVVVGGCGEIFLGLGQLLGGLGWVGWGASGLLTWGVGLVWMHGWNRLLVGSKGLQGATPQVVFLASLGASLAATGLVGLVRGPGLRQAPTLLPRVPLLDGDGVGLQAILFVVAGTALVGWVRWLGRRPVGYALALLAQDRQFAMELGVEPAGLARHAALVVGTLGAVIALYLVYSEGSTPTSGMPVFLYGASASLVLPRKSLGSAVIAGLLLGIAFVAAQLVMSHEAANALVFSLIGGILLARGSSRFERSVR